MNFKLSVRDDKGITLGVVDVNPRTRKITKVEAEAILKLPDDQRDMALRTLARQVSSAIGPEEMFQVCRIMTQAK